MEQNRTKNTIRNMICGGINKIIVLIFPFIIRTIIIKILGTQYLGLNSLFTSILQVLNLTELGFNSAIVFSMYKPIANNNEYEVCALLNLYKKIYRIIGIIICFLGVVLIPFLPKLINGTYPSEINIYSLYLIYLFNTVITYFLFAYKSALITAHQRNDILSNVNTILCIFQYTFQIIVLIVLKNYYIYILINSFVNVFNNLIIAYITKKKFPQYICKGNVSKDGKNEIKKRVFGLMIQKICATTRNSLDSIFLSFFLGLNIVAIYSNYYVILKSVMSFLEIITLSMVASIGNSIAKESEEKNYRDMNKFNFLYMWIAGWAMICLICLYQPFMKLWMGEMLLFPMSSVILLSLLFYILKSGDILSVFFQATGLWYEGRYRALVETFLNILLNYILGKKYGVNGIISATIISLLVVNFGYGSKIIFKYYFKKFKVFEYYLKQLIYFIITIIVAFITFFICECININNNILELAVKAVCCCIIPNVFYYIVYRKYYLFIESKNFFIKILDRKGKKRES